MEKRKCSKCKGYFTSNIIIYSSSYRKGERCVYYRCNNCNTEHHRKYRNTEVGRKNIYKAVYKSIKKYKYKQDARMALNNAVRQKKIIKPKKCSKCNKVKPLEGHHEDYSRPLWIVWLCRQCHCMI